MPSKQQQFDIKKGEDRDRYIRRVRGLLYDEVGEDATLRYRRAHQLYIEAVERKREKDAQEKGRQKAKKKTETIMKRMKKEPIKAVAATPDIIAPKTEDAETKPVQD